ncbi:MAG: N-acetylmuramoyl-L-alanine amidase [Croceitalea sp.]|nr:N-acetylmuramoyl-L-alanine amidase [Croceitalea sp.]
MKKNRLLHTLFLAFIFLFSSFGVTPLNPRINKKFVVVLDAGHGGHDPGNLGNGYLEKNIALAIVLEVGKQLEKNPDIKVVYTRKDDSFVDLFIRGEIANQANADLFVSVHCDSHSSDAYGAGTFVLGLHANKQNFEVAKKENSVIYLEDNYEQKYAEYDINSPESIIGLTILQEEFLDQSVQLAKLLQDNFTDKLRRKDRKVKQAGFIVLHQTFMPSVLIETGFLTNKNEGSYLNSSRGQKEMGTAIANAILTYKDGVEANLSEFEPSPEPVEEVALKVPEKDIAVEKTEIEKPNEAVVEKKPEITKISEKAPSPKPVTKQAEAKETAQIETPKKPVDTTPLTSPEKKIEQADEGVTFKVQIMATTKTIALQASNFKGLENLSKEPYKNMFRYTCGDTNSFAEAKKIKATATTKGYKDAFIVAYKNGSRIPIKEALNSRSVE